MTSRFQTVAGKPATALFGLNETIFQFICSSNQVSIFLCGLMHGFNHYLF